MKGPLGSTETSLALHDSLAVPVEKTMKKKAHYNTTAVGSSINTTLAVEH